jgi:hypothetical protein
MIDYANTIRDKAVDAELKLRKYYDELSSAIDLYTNARRNGDTEKASEYRKAIIALIVAAIMSLGYAYYYAVIEAGKIFYGIDETIIRYGNAAITEIVSRVTERTIEEISEVLESGVPENVLSKLGEVSSGIARATGQVGGHVTRVGAVTSSPLDGGVDEFIGYLIAAGIGAILSQYAPAQYVYIHLNNMEGICSKCAPFVGRVCNGIGTDGVPVPPQHKNCRCALVPYVPGAMQVENDPIANLRKLTYSDLSKIIGPIRVDLLRSGKLRIDDLFADNYSRLKTLEELGFNKAGRPL